MKGLPVTHTDKKKCLKINHALIIIKDPANAGSIFFVLLIACGFSRMRITNGSSVVDIGVFPNVGIGYFDTAKIDAAIRPFASLRFSECPDGTYVNLFEKFRGGLLFGVCGRNDEV